HALNPQEKVPLVVQTPSGEQKNLEILSKITEKKRFNLSNYADIQEWDRRADKDDKTRLTNHRFQEFGQDLVIWKMPEFDLYNEEEVDKMMKKVEGHKAIIFDLRGNPGGYAEMLQYLAGYFFDHEVKIAEFKSRKPMKPSIAKPRGKNVF